MACRTDSSENIAAKADVVARLSIKRPLIFGPAAQVASIPVGPLI
jgi:hypothetical protein